MGIIKIPDKSIKKFQENYHETLKTGNLAEGKWNKALVDYFRFYTGAQASIPFASNGSGLLAILILLRRYRGFKHVFVQSNTMYGVKTIAISSNLNYIGAVSCRLPSLMPNAAEVEKFISGIREPARTIFVISHIGGTVNPEIEEIASICKTLGVALIEDCAHSFGATLNGKHTGLFSIAGVYSLYATKAITAGEGGIAVTNDSDLAEKLIKFNIYDRFEQIQDVGVNFRISELQALFSLCVSEMVEDIISNKTKIANRYIEACRNSNIHYVDPYLNGQRGNHYKFILISNKNINIEFLSIKQRTSSVYNYSLGKDPDQISKKHICIPIWYGLEEYVIQEVVNELQRNIK